MNQYLNKIIQGDSLEILRQLPSNSVDAVITDPPYSSGGRTIAEIILLGRFIVMLLSRTRLIWCRV
ncbi:DNA modification methylase [Sporomusaceae bacterium BoRhaA]|nr:DNA modification methylase [Pelorhabdus rhamnosifermentans]